MARQEFRDSAKPKTIADVGCGDGAFLYALSQVFPQAVLHGIEPERFGRQLALAQLGKHAVVAKIVERLDEYPAGYFDLIFCLEVIEHVSQPDHLIKLIYRALKPGGIAIISTPIRLTEKPWDEEHSEEFFPEQFKIKVGNYLIISNSNYSTSVAAISIYEWRLGFLGVPLGKYLMNGLYLLSGINILHKWSPLLDFWLTQTHSCRKASEDQI